MSDVDIGHSGSALRLIASNTFPVGFEVTDIADDSDPLDIVENVIGDMANNANGGSVSWSISNPDEITIAVIPGSTTQRNLNILFQANRPQKGKRLSRDTITLVRRLPNGSVASGIEGRIIAGPPAASQASTGRLKSMMYRFKFNRIIEGPPV